MDRDAFPSFLAPDPVAEERRARDEMIRNGMAPRPESEIAVTLAAMRIAVEDLGDRVLLGLPPGWAAEADPTNHRRWYLTDERRRRRVACFWKENAYTPGRGAVALVEDDGIERRWSGREGQLYATERKVRLVLQCSRCNAPERMVLDFTADIVEERPAYVDEVVRRQEERFRAAHRCPPSPVAIPIARGAHARIGDEFFPVVDGYVYPVT